jgi:hypothetical protein
MKLNEAGVADLEFEVGPGELEPFETLAAEPRVEAGVREREFEVAQQQAAELNPVGPRQTMAGSDET